VTLPVGLGVGAKVVWSVTFSVRVAVGLGVTISVGKGVGIEVTGSKVEGSKVVGSKVEGISVSLKNSVVENVESWVETPATENTMRTTTGRIFLGNLIPLQALLFCFCCLQWNNVQTGPFLTRNN
jgi:hypothetical protein